MKFSTRARYGLRMMVELARELRHEKLVHLGKVARVTGLSVNYLAQLAIPLKAQGLLIGVSGKNGGYKLGRNPEDIAVSDILNAVQGPISLTDCANNPDLCLNSSFCEARMVWVLAAHRMMEVFDSFSLADLIDREWVKRTLQEFSSVPLLDSDKYLSKESHH